MERETPNPGWCPDGMETGSTRPRVGEDDSHAESSRKHGYGVPLMDPTSGKHRSDVDVTIDGDVPFHRSHHVLKGEFSNLCMAETASPCCTESKNL